MHKDQGHQNRPSPSPTPPHPAVAAPSLWRMHSTHPTFFCLSAISKAEWVRWLSRVLMRSSPGESLVVELPTLLREMEGAGRPAWSAVRLRVAGADGVGWTEVGGCGIETTGAGEFSYSETPS